MESVKVSRGTIVVLEPDPTINRSSDNCPCYWRHLPVGSTQSRKRAIKRVNCVDFRYSWNRPPPDKANCGHVAANGPTKHRECIATISAPLATGLPQAAAAAGGCNSYSGRTSLCCRHSLRSSKQPLPPIQALTTLSRASRYTPRESTIS